MTRVAHDPRSIVRARGALNDVRNGLAAAASRTRAVSDQAHVAEIPELLADVQAALEKAWEAVAYVDAELAAFMDGD